MDSVTVDDMKLHGPILHHTARTYKDPCVFVQKVMQDFHQQQGMDRLPGVVPKCQGSTPGKGANTEVYR